MITSLLKKYRTILIASCTLSAVSAASGIAVLGWINNHILSLNEEDGLAAAQLASCLSLIMIMVLLGVASQYYLAKLSANVVADLRMNIVRGVLDSDYQTIERTGGHKIYAALSSDTTRISRGIAALPEYVYSIATVALCLSYIGYLSYQMLIILMLFIASAITAASLILRRTEKYLKRLRDVDDDLFNQYKALVEGRRELSLNAMRKKFFYGRLFLPTIFASKENSVKSQAHLALLSNLSNAFVFLAMVCLIFSSSVLLPNVAVGTLASVMLVFIYMIGPLGFLVDNFGRLLDAKLGFHSIVRFQALLQPDPALTGLSDSAARDPAPWASSSWKSITLEDLQYEYRGQEQNGEAGFRVGPINMVLNRGEVIFITGGNGSGKSTFAKLLTGLYRPTSGKIFVDGCEVRCDEDGSAYRQLFTTIFSDFFLFEHVLDKDGRLADDSEIERSLSALKLEGKVTSSGGKLSTVFLSHGQRKRLAMLVSRMEDAPACLFDEWAADQDVGFKDHYYKNILKEMRAQNKLVIAISHDENYFQYCDRMYKFEQGLVYEEHSAGRAGSAILPESKARSVSA